MVGILEKAQKFLLGGNNDLDGEYEYEDDDDVEMEEEEEAPVREKRTNNASRQSNRERSSEASGKIARIYPEVHQMEIVMARPESVDDAPIIVDNVKNNNVCIINLEGVEKEKAQRIADFLGGASYALRGSIERVSNEIFIMAPNGVNISGKLKDEAKSLNSIFPWISAVR